MRKLLALVLLLVPIALAQTSDIAEELNRKYAKHMLRLQMPLQGDSLAFNSDGRVVRGKPGIAGMDDSINIDRIKVENTGVTIDGTRALLIMSPVDGSVKYGTTKPVRLSLSTGSAPTLEAAETAIAKIFAAAGSRSCTPEETVDFATRVTGNSKAPWSATVPPIWVCLPTGGRGIWGGGGVNGPKLVQQGTPVYPRPAAKPWVGKIKLHVLVDERGLPREAVTVAGPGVGAMYDRIAIRQWRYEPATKDGVPVPAVSTLEVEISVN